MFSVNYHKLLTHTQFRCLSLSVLYAKSHYDSLGITPKATQSDIKSAYYKLSMVYHPDKNKGSVVASNKFRDINAAYEVLGNFKLRKLYDKGILHTAGPQYSGMTQDIKVEESEEDEQTKFYKSRIHRSKPPTPTGRTPIYNYDEWSQAHYGEIFTRREAAKEKYEMKRKQKVSQSHDIEKETIIYGIGIVILAFVVISYLNFENHDVVTQNSVKSDVSSEDQQIN